MKIGKKVEDIKISKNMDVTSLVAQMEKSGGFTAKKVGVGVNILEKMFKEKDCVKFLSFPACIIATGCRGVIKELVKRKMVDVVITTSGTLDHDLARAWKNYYHGDFSADDISLHKHGVNRLGNVLIPNENYGIILEKKMQPVLKEMYKNKKEYSTKEIIWEFGKRIKNENSIIYWCYKNKIPMFVPGITDGAFGSNLWMFWQMHKDFKIDLFRDEHELSDIVFTAKKTGALMIGGGISKHHTIWWNQFRNGLDYAVYITTAVEYDGSLSGARIREGISWGKVKEKAKEITIEGDSTVLLPLMIGAVMDRL
ncbi:deoxyhypusine synthase [archaeon]|nr:deoxyhypusine synthase [archaeon]MBU4255870.1 deoxyhypusine synthase [Candidatus Thermoplasmatota archaeon]